MFKFEEIKAMQRNVNGKTMACYWLKNIYIIRNIIYLILIINILNQKLLYMTLSKIFPQCLLFWIRLKLWNTITIHHCWRSEIYSLEDVTCFLSNRRPGYNKFAFTKFCWYSGFKRFKHCWYCHRIVVRCCGHRNDSKFSRIWLGFYHYFYLRFVL